MSTPTPGAASELQADGLTYVEAYAIGIVAEECGETVQACGKALRFGLENGGSHTDSTSRDKIAIECGDALAAIEFAITRGLISREAVETQSARKLAKLNDPESRDGIGRRLAPPPQEAPAPVTEGAQREAVAFDIEFDDGHRNLYYADELAEHMPMDIEAHGEIGHQEPLYTATPPTDQVQPERVEGECPNCVSPFKCNGPHIGAAPAHGYEEAPPTDASGGVTEKVMNLVRDIALCDCAFCMRKKAEIQGALEAADRARKQGEEGVDESRLKEAYDDANAICNKSKVDSEIERRASRIRAFLRVWLKRQSEQHIGAVIPDAGK